MPIPIFALHNLYLLMNPFRFLPYLNFKLLLFNYVLSFLQVIHREITNFELLGPLQVLQIRILFFLKMDIYQLHLLIDQLFGVAIDPILVPFQLFSDFIFLILYSLKLVALVLFRLYLVLD